MRSHSIFSLILSYSLQHLHQTPNSSSMVSHSMDVADPPHPRNHTAVFRRPGGLLDGPGWKVSRPDGRRSAKLLMNVTVQGSMGPVQVVMAAESKVAELIKAAVEAYRREKRRPLLKVSCEDDDADSVFELHYSSFSLDCLNLDEQLINLASRNFYLCAKPPCKREVTCSYQTKTTNAKSQFPFAKLLDFLLEIFFRRETSSHMTDRLANRLYLMT